MSNSNTKKNPSSLIIAGTDYDRRRKVTKKMATKMKKMVDAGKSMSTIASTFGVSTYAVKTNTNKAFLESERARYRDYNNNRRIPVEATPEDIAERNAYKADLIRSRRKIEQWVK